MEAILDSFQHFLDPNWIMKNGGLYLVLLILFVEVGFFFGFFLPGDPLLFVAGMVIGAANETPYPFMGDTLNLLFWMSLFMLATILGNYLGYWLGKKFEFFLKNKKDSWLFKRKYIDAAHEFYENKGGFAIAIARFLPIVRTFAPLIAGMVRMKFRKFGFYNILGAIIWVGSITMLGFILGDHPWVRDNIAFVIIGLVVVVTAPVLFKATFKREKVL